MRERDPVHDILDAWAEDTVTRERHPSVLPLLQVDIIPLFSGWVRAMRSIEQPISAYNFVTCVTEHESAHATWKTEALKAGDFYAHVDALPVDRYLRFLDANGARSPYSITRHLFLDGRPATDEPVPGVELSLVEALGHAAYNSTSGMRYVAVYPKLDIPEEHPEGFLGFAGPRLISALEAL